jgi:hypothetical protein
MDSSSASQPIAAAAERTVALVTAAPARGLDGDMPPLLAALGLLGIGAREVVWDDPTVDWDAFDLVVVRSAWDYFARREAFVAWAERVEAATRLENPAAVLRWNSDKRYLRELDAAGVPIVPTTFLAPGEALDLPEGGDLIVKPAVSAGSNDTARHRDGDRGAAMAHVQRLHDEGRVAMVQPYQRAVDERGETALVYFDGELSHAIEKGAIFAAGPQMVGGLFAREQIRPRMPTAAERAAGETVLRALARSVPAEAMPLLYARVDLVPLADGTPGLLELELCEPSVFLASADGAAARFGAAIAARLPGKPTRAAV